MKTVTVDNYREDKYYPRVVRAVAKVLSRSNVVAPVDVLLEMGNLTKQNVEAWRHGKVPYLEYVIDGNLSKATRILRIIGFHVHDLNMVPQRTVYRQSDFPGTAFSGSPSPGLRGSRKPTQGIMCGISRKRKNSKL